MFKIFNYKLQQGIIVKNIEIKQYSNKNIKFYLKFKNKIKQLKSINLLLSFYKLDKLLLNKCNKRNVSRKSVFHKV